MIESSKAAIESLVVHQIGDKNIGEDVHFSKSPLDILSFDEGVLDILKQFFFKPFKTELYYNFAHEDGVENNTIFQCAKRIFDNPSEFYDVSVEVAEYLHYNSNHPNIRSGEFYMAYFNDCVVDGLTCNAIGIFKSENKEMFLKVYLNNETYELGTQEGINIRRLDKGCLIFDIEREEGFRVCAIDNINKSKDAKFWMQDFLSVKSREDKYFYTDNYLQICKGFVKDVYNADSQVPRPEQIDMMNRSIDYFNENPEFNQQSFEENVLQQPDVATAFKEYKNEYENRLNTELPDGFEISKDAVKGEKKNFKTVLKLDKNFHVYIHGNRQFLEKGYDESRDLNYYKLFFRAEL